MDNLKCIVCSKPFPFRKGKLYCSNSCKQQGYNNKKNGKIDGVGENGNKKRTFYFENYRNFLKQNPGYDSVDFVSYCFAIKNHDENENIFFINEFAINIVTDEFMLNLKKESHPIGQQFSQFQNEFHLGNFKIKDKRDELENITSA